MSQVSCLPLQSPSLPAAPQLLCRGSACSKQQMTGRCSKHPQLDRVWTPVHLACLTDDGIHRLVMTVDLSIPHAAGLQLLRLNCTRNSKALPSCSSSWKPCRYCMYCCCKACCRHLLNCCIHIIRKCACLGNTLETSTCLQGAVKRRDAEIQRMAIKAEKGPDASQMNLRFKNETNESIILQLNSQATFFPDNVCGQHGV